MEELQSNISNSKNVDRLIRSDGSRDFLNNATKNVDLSVFLDNFNRESDKDSYKVDNLVFATEKPAWVGGGDYYDADVLFLSSDRCAVLLWGYENYKDRTAYDYDDPLKLLMNIFRCDDTSKLLKMFVVFESETPFSSGELANAKVDWIDMVELFDGNIAILFTSSVLDSASYQDNYGCWGYKIVSQQGQNIYMNENIGCISSSRNRQKFADNLGGALSSCRGLYAVCGGGIDATENGFVIVWKSQIRGLFEELSYKLLANVFDSRGKLIAVSDNSVDDPESTDCYFSTFIGGYEVASIGGIITVAWQCNVWVWDDIDMFLALDHSEVRTRAFDANLKPLSDNSVLIDSHKVAMSDINAGWVIPADKLTSEKAFVLIWYKTININDSHNSYHAINMKVWGLNGEELWPQIEVNNTLYIDDQGAAVGGSYYDSCVLLYNGGTFNSIVNDILSHSFNTFIQMKVFKEANFGGIGDIVIAWTSDVDTRNDCFVLYAKRCIKGLCGDVDVFNTTYQGSGEERSEGEFNLAYTTNNGIAVAYGIDDVRLGIGGTDMLLSLNASHETDNDGGALISLNIAVVMCFIVSDVILSCFDM